MSVNQFTGQTIDAARRALATRLAAAANDSAELDARLLVGAALGLDLTGMITAAHRALTADESTPLQALAPRRPARAPVPRSLGITECWGLALPPPCRTPGPASTEAPVRGRRSSEKAWAANVESRPSTMMRRLSRTVSFNAAFERAARSALTVAVEVQAAIPHRTTSGITPATQVLRHLKSPCLQGPAGREPEKKQTLG